jgi:hypothetical protein
LKSDFVEKLEAIILESVENQTITEEELKKEVSEWFKQFGLSTHAPI